MQKTIKRWFPLFLLIIVYSSFKAPNFYKPLKKYMDSLPANFDSISDDRKKDLKEIGEFILYKKSQHQIADLTFICTSNSRRSHFAQIWMHTAALYYCIDSISAFSGGTEATEPNKRVIAALLRVGFTAVRNDTAYNSPYQLRVGAKIPAWTIFSKKYDHLSNPQQGFCAIMICSEADKSCPIVPGADERIGLPFLDPKRFDGLDIESAEYDKTCRLIATEIFFVADYVKKKLTDAK